MMIGYSGKTFSTLNGNDCHQCCALDRSQPALTLRFRAGFFYNQSFSKFSQTHIFFVCLFADKTRKVIHLQRKCVSSSHQKSDGSELRHDEIETSGRRNKSFFVSYFFPWFLHKMGKNVKKRKYILCTHASKQKTKNNVLNDKRCFNRAQTGLRYGTYLRQSSYCLNQLNDTVRSGSVVITNFVKTVTRNCNVTRFDGIFLTAKVRLH